MDLSSTIAELQKFMVMAKRKNSDDTHIDEPCENKKFCDEEGTCGLIIKICDKSYFINEMIAKNNFTFMANRQCITTIYLSLQETTASAVSLLYDWLQKEQPQIECKELLAQYKAARFLTMDKWIEQFWNLLNDEYYVERNAVDMFYESKEMELINIRDLMLPRIKLTLMCLIANSQFKMLSCAELCSSLSSENIGLNSELEVAFTIILWMDLVNWKCSQTELAQLATCIHFKRMKTASLEYLVREQNSNVKRFVQHDIIRTLIYNAVLCNAAKNAGTDEQQMYGSWMDHLPTPSHSRQSYAFNPDCQFDHAEQCPNYGLLTFEQFLEKVRIEQSKLQLQPRCESSTIWLAKKLDICPNCKTCIATEESKRNSVMNVTH